MLLFGAGAAGCGGDDPIDPRAAVLEVLLDGCGRGVEDRATATAIGDGLALTVAHSFDDARAVALRAVDGDEVAAELVFIDRDRDIALLRFDEAPGASPQPTLIVRSDADDPTDEARIVVHRDGANVIETVLVVQRTAVTLDGEGRRDGIELSAVIEPGDSGAPLLGDDEHIIGMVFASSRTSDTGWAIAASELETIADNAGEPIVLSC